MVSPSYNIGLAGDSDCREIVREAPSGVRRSKESPPVFSSQPGLMRLFLAALLSTASAFTLPVAPAASSALGRTTTTTMGLFDGFAKAFENDSSLGDRKNAGLTKEKTKRTVTWVGPRGQKKQALCVPGQSLKDIARASGIPIRYDCQEGTCKTCEAQVPACRLVGFCVLGNVTWQASRNSCRLFEI